MQENSYNGGRHIRASTHYCLHHWQRFERFLMCERSSTDRNNSVKMVSRVLPLFQHVRPGNYRLKEIWLLECVYIYLLFSMVSLCVCTVGEHACKVKSLLVCLHNAHVSSHRTKSLHFTIKWCLCFRLNTVDYIILICRKVQQFPINDWIRAPLISALTTVSPIASNCRESFSFTVSV